MKMNYKGKIDNIDYIVISDPMYEKNISYLVLQWKFMFYRVVGKYCSAHTRQFSKCKYLINRKWKKTNNYPIEL